MRSKCGIKCILALIILLFSVSIAGGQTRQINLWYDTLNQIQALPADALEMERDNLSRIRAGVELWIRAHPETTISLAAVSNDPARETNLLIEAVAKILEEDSGQAFRLGQTSITVTAEASILSPITDSLSRNEITNLYITDVAEAVQYLPGITIEQSSGKNQTGIIIRGFDTKQVGIYMDNIPLLVPYDGFADIGRFLTSEIASIDVAKGYSSPLLGPNGLGGAINLVTRQPERKFEGEMKMGTGSGDRLESGIHIGSRLDKFFFRVGMDWVQTSYYPLSGKMPVYGTTQTTYERINSDQRDVRYSGRFGITPNASDQYVFTYTKQKAEYGIPPYSGSDAAHNRTQWRRWGFWNRDSYYLNTNTELGEYGSIRLRAFLDYYPNQFQFFNANYAMKTGWSNYDDYSQGFSAEFNTQMIPHHSLSASFFMKGDTHSQQDISVSNGTISISNLWKKDRDILTSIGFQDVISISSKLHATIGASFDHLNAAWAEDSLTVDGVLTLVPFIECGQNPEKLFSSCLASSWTANPLASVSYSTSKSGTLFFTFAQKSRLPSMTDRYSRRSGGGVPNPTIKPEHSRNYSLGYMRLFGFNTIGQIELFRSDMYDAIEIVNIPEAFTNQCPGSFLPGFCSQSINIGKALNKGAEITLRSNPVRRFTLNTNYTYLQRKIYDAGIYNDVTAIYPTGTPKHRVNATAEFQLPFNILISAAQNYEAGRFHTITDTDRDPVTNAETTRVTIVPSSNFGTTDIGGVFTIHRGVKVQIGTKNLFDRFYYKREGYPEAGRTWYLNTRYSF